MTRLPSYGYAGGAALAGVGVVLARRRPRTGAVVLTAGLAGLAMAQIGRRAPTLPPTYDPIDTLKPLAERVFVVDSGPLHGVMPLRMTVIQLADGGLLLHSPTRFTPALLAELEAVGPVRALVAPNIAHWIYLRDWQRACPDARTWAVPGLRRRRQVKQAGVVIDHELSGTPPLAWGGGLELLSVPGAFGFSETALFHRPSRTLVLTDLVLNLEPERLPALLRPVARLLGVTAPVGRAPFYLRAVVRQGGWAARHAAGRLVRLDPARVVFAHGRIFDQDAASSLARSLSWLHPEGKEMA